MHMHLINITKNQQSKVRSPHRVQSLNSSRPQQSIFRRAPTTRRPRYGRHGGGNRLAGFLRMSSHRSGPFRAQLKLELPCCRGLLLSCDDSRQPLLPPAAAASPAWCTCTGPLPRCTWLEEASAPLAATPLPPDHTPPLCPPTRLFPGRTQRALVAGHAYGPMPPHRWRCMCMRPRYFAQSPTRARSYTCICMCMHILVLMCDHGRARLYRSDSARSVLQGPGQSQNSSRPQQCIFRPRPAPTTRHPRYGRHGGGNRLAGFPRTPSHRSGPFRAQLKLELPCCRGLGLLLSRDDSRPLLPPAASHAYAWCACGIYAVHVHRSAQVAKHSERIRSMRCAHERYGAHSERIRSALRARAFGVYSNKFGAAAGTCTARKSLTSDRSEPGPYACTCAYACACSNVREFVHMHICMRNIYCAILMHMGQRSRSQRCFEFFDPRRQY